MEPPAGAGPLNTRRSSRLTRHVPAGFTMLEVLLALFIVGVGVVLLSDGYTQNLRAINADREDTTLSLLAQAKMSEVVAGITPPDLEGEGSFEELGYSEEYGWRLESLPTGTSGLNTVSVTAFRATEYGTREFTLYRLVYDALEAGESLGLGP